MPGTPTITPGPWVAWFERDETGRITEAGVDTADRAVNICVTTCENVEIDDVEAHNRYVMNDTNLLAASSELLDALVKARQHVTSSEWGTRHAAENKYCPYCANDGDDWIDQKEHHPGCAFMALVAEIDAAIAKAKGA